MGLSSKSNSKFPPIGEAAKDSAQDDHYAKTTYSAFTMQNNDRSPAQATESTKAMSQQQKMEAVKPSMAKLSEIQSDTAIKDKQIVKGNQSIDQQTSQQDQDKAKDAAGAGAGEDDDEYAND